MIAILTRYSQEHVTIKMLASYLKNLPTKPMLEDDPLDINWPFNYDMDDRREANTLTTRDIEALSWKLREASDADMHHSSISPTKQKPQEKFLHSLTLETFPFSFFRSSSSFIRAGFSMEKFQMLFPFPSTGSPNYSVSSSMTDSSHVFHNFQADSSGGFLGLKTETQHPVPRTPPEINKDLNSQSASFAIGSETGPQAAKKKGEKKIRKPKYAFQTRSQVDILDDGYRWRKYGQKAVKNNKFPRSYYRCTYQGCDVKKQVQRLTKDEGVVVTTYEGMHTHPIEKPNDNFEHILSQMQIYSTPF
ncbi:WRKY transcription factor 75 [Populus alba x Populus x berolinensis]|nr:WRKY transcription factor 75 [Populus alba x Populus x berolinensis]